jgi:hypothetical protein
LLRLAIAVQHPPLPLLVLLVQLEAEWWNLLYYRLCHHCQHCKQFPLSRYAFLTLLLLLLLAFVQELFDALLAMPQLCDLTLSGVRLTPVAGLDSGLRRSAARSHTCCGSLCIDQEQHHSRHCCAAEKSHSLLMLQALLPCFMQEVCACCWYSGFHVGSYCSEAGLPHRLRMFCCVSCC